MSAKADGGLLTHRVILSGTAHTPTKLDGAYRVLMRAFGQAADSVSFDPARFAYFLSNTEGNLRRWFLTLSIQFITIMAERAELGLARDEEDVILSQDCKAILEKGVNVLG